MVAVADVDNGDAGDLCLSDGKLRSTDRNRDAQSAPRVNQRVGRAVRNRSVFRAATDAAGLQADGVALHPHHAVRMYAALIR